MMNVLCSYFSTGRDRYSYFCFQSFIFFQGPSFFHHRVDLCRYLCEALSILLTLSWLNDFLVEFFLSFPLDKNVSYDLLFQLLFGMLFFIFPPSRFENST